MWILVEAAIMAIRKGSLLNRVCQRFRKRSGAKKARVAVAGKLAEICWKRLVGWHGRVAVSYTKIESMRTPFGDSDPLNA